VLIHPENIFPGAAIRAVREEGVAAVLLSIRLTALWSSTTVITVYRDPNPPLMLSSLASCVWTGCTA
jgi:hypothetical protein